MKLNENVQFESRVVLDLNTYREFSQGYMAVLPSQTAIHIIAIVYLAAYILAMGYMGNHMGFPAAAVIVLLIFGVTKLVNRGGGLQYKRMVSNNGGQPVRNCLTMADGNIHIENMDNGNSMNYGLDKIWGIAETQNLLILMLDYRQGLVVDKRTLTGTVSGEPSAEPASDLTKYLLASCPNLKKRKVKTGRGARIRRGIIALLLVFGLVLALVQGIFGGSGSGLYDGENYDSENYDGDGAYFGYSEMKMNGLTFTEIAEELESIGFSAIDRTLTEGLEKSWAISAEEYTGSVDKVTVLLSAVGFGTYDDTTWEWAPSSSNVYAFDMEMFNLETMYTEFLQGVSALGDGELDFTDIEENLDDVDWENGTGSRSVFFQWNGNNVALGADMMNDWFDLDFANDLNVLVQTHCEGKQLYFTTDGYQEIYVFYCDAEWAAEFEEVTGLRLWESLR